MTPPLRIRSVPLLTTYMELGGSPSVNSTCPLASAICGYLIRSAIMSPFSGFAGTCSGGSPPVAETPGLLRGEVRGLPIIAQPLRERGCGVFARGSTGIARHPGQADPVPKQIQLLRRRAACRPLSSEVVVDCQ